MSHSHLSSHTSNVNERKIFEQQSMLNSLNSESLLTETDRLTSHQSEKKSLNSTDTSQKSMKTEDTAQNSSICDLISNSLTKSLSCSQSSMSVKKFINMMMILTESDLHTSDDKTDIDRNKVKFTEQTDVNSDHEALILTALKLNVVKQTFSDELSFKSLSDSVIHNKLTSAAEQSSTFSCISLSIKLSRTWSISKEFNKSENDNSNDQSLIRSRQQWRFHDSLTAENESALLNITSVMSEFSVKQFINVLNESWFSQNAELQNEHVDEKINDMYINLKLTCWSLTLTLTDDSRVELLTFHLLRFEEFQNELVLTQIIFINWTDFISFFKCESDKLKAQNVTHIFFELHIELKLHQLFTVYWMLMKRIEENEKDFIMNKQELDKTLTAIVMMIVQHLISMTQQKMMIDHENEDNSCHLSLKQSQLSDAVCLSNSFFFSCLCLKKNKTSSLHIKHRSVLIVILTKLIFNWVREFEKFINVTVTFRHSDQFINMTLLVTHNNTKTDHCSHLESFWQLILNINSDFNDISLFMYSNYKVNHILILMTLQFYKANIEDILHVNVTSLRSIRDKSFWSHQISQYEDWIHWSNIVYNEMHEIKSMLSQFMQLMLSCKRNSYTWFMMRTLFKMFTLNLQSFFSIIDQDVQNLKCFSKQQLMNLNRAFQENAHSSSDLRTLTALSKTLEKFWVTFEQFMICCLIFIRWFNQTIVKLSSHYQENISMMILFEYKTFFTRLKMRQNINIHNRMFRENKQTLNIKKLTFNFVFQSSYMHQLCMSATCSHLTQLCVKHKLQLTMNEYRSHSWIQKSQQSLYYQNISDIVWSSVKFSKLKKIIIQKMQSCKISWMKKIVILSVFSVAVICVKHISKLFSLILSFITNSTSNVQLFFFWLQWLQKYHLNVKFIILHLYMKINKCQNLIDTFQTNNEHMIIIETIDIMKIEMTLIHVITLILLKSDYTLKKKKQIYFCNYWIDQNCSTHTYHLILTNFWMKQLILNKQKKCALMQKKTMKCINDNMKKSIRVKQKKTELCINNDMKMSVRVDLTLSTQIIDLN